MALSFSQRAGLYLLMVGVCSIGYVLVATFGSWSLLSAKGWRHHSWSGFALVGLGASVLSVFTVNSVRGFGGETLRQVSVVDLNAGASYGFATVYFGLKTSLDTKLDLWLPEDPLSATEPGRTNCFLRPNPASSDLTMSRSAFTDPEAYRVIPASAVIHGARIRGTLKRFEGRWEGPVAGTVSADIAVRLKDVRNLFLDGSYIVNELGVDLLNCYLLLPIRELTDVTGFRSSEIYAFPIGDLPASGGRVDVAERCYRPEEDETPVAFLSRSTLAEAQKAWGAEIRNVLSDAAFGSAGRRTSALGEERNALLLLSTVNEYDASKEVSMTQFMTGATTWSRDRGRQLDLRERLPVGSAVLIGFAEDPGPVRLFRRAGDAPYHMLTPDPDHSWTMYRIHISVRLLDRDREEEEKDVIK